MSARGELLPSRCALAILLGVLILLGGGGPARAQSAAKVTVGYLPVISFAPIFIAMDKGYYAEAKGVAVKKSFAEEVPALRESQVAVIIYSGRFIREKRNLARGWMKAYVKGIRYNNRYGMKSKEVAPILAEYTHVPIKVTGFSRWVS